MALSNWDTLAVDLTGKSCSGSFASPTGIEVEFYKNWIYVRDTKAWTADSGYSEPTVMTFQHGDVSYKDVTLEAVRGPQNGIYCVVTSGYGETMTGMVGCGVYGFEGSEWVGVQPESRQFLQDFLSKPEHIPTREEGIECLKRMTTSYSDGLGGWVETSFYDQCVQLGHLEESLKIYMEPTFRFDKRIQNISLDGATRFNQGDAYFAENAGLPLNETEVGSQKEPHIIKMVEGMKE